MASPTTPMHGKLGALYAVRPNGYVGVASSLGLNDLTWGVASSAGADTIYVVTIDHTAGPPDTFTWTVNGAGGAADVAITGAEQTLADGQKLTFAAVAGHTVGDSWTIGNFKATGCDEVGAIAQITTATKRLLNPNRIPLFTDAGGKNVIDINFTTGTATFDGNVGVVTVEGNQGFFPAAALQKVAYLIDWNLSVTLDMADASRMGQQWKEALPGQAGATGSANAYFIANQTMLNNIQSTIAGGDKYFLLQLFNYDPDQDQTGDHINAWVSFTSFGIGADIGSVVKESLNLQVVGGMSFVSNV
jgi:hypothetical protein